MPFPRPTLTEIIERTFSDIKSRMSLPAAILRRSVVGILARVIAGASHMLHGHLDWIAREANPATAIATLPLWAAVWGISRRDAEFAVGTVDFTGTIDGTTIPAGTILNRSDGVEFATDSDVAIASGVASVSVTAVLSGELGNTDAATILTIVEPIGGVSSSATVDGDALTGGIEVEDDDSLRARLLARIQRPPHGGNANDYETWAKEVAGVTRAWVYPLYYGVGTVGITFVRDDDAGSIIPSAGEVTAVQDYIDSVRPVTADATVFAPVADPLAFTIAVLPNTLAVKTAVEAELADFLRREAEPGGTLYWSRIDEAISLASGETSHVMTVPAGNVVSPAGHIATLGVITWL